MAEEQYPPVEVADETDPSDKQCLRAAKVTYRGRVYRVCTMHMYLAFGFRGPTMWYETAVLPYDHWKTIYARRYSTRRQAVQGHEEVMQSFLDGTIELPTE
jgi:hypothetical protein